MRTIIAGSRDGVTARDVQQALAECGWRPTVVLCGDARGADTLGRRWALSQGIPCERYPADWDRYGRSAGHRRNQQMAAHAEALVALWDSCSSGTRDMIELARQKGLRVYIYWVAPPSPDKLK